MQTQNTLQISLTDCRFCSLVSKANSEDQIGTAVTCDRWVIMEFRQPWTLESFQQNPILKALMTGFQQVVLQHGINLRPMLIAPDREYSVPNFTRVLYYYRPAKMFAKFEKQEYLVPEGETIDLITAILNHSVNQPNDLPRFQQYQQQTNHIREILVCTHAQIDLACGRFGTPLYRRLRKEYAPVANGKLRVWQTSHFGGHQFAPTLADFPQGRLWGHLEPQVLDLLIQQNGSHSDLRQYYRGWSGLTKFEQIAEREIWMQLGWSWFDYLKAGEIVAQEQVDDKHEANWAEVRIHFAATDGSTSGIYEARIEAIGEVMSALNSGKPMQLKPVKQYHVSHLVKIQ
ncbi:sucrase ferredoxin [Chlorogloeopsis sp. ULAP02]|uniref:sucrase ferredoxin n=1 Tax=Chlorogloeopsis sp. ULAP02 TaxID=3107926 RepID=UPI00313580FA